MYNRRAGGAPVRDFEDIEITLPPPVPGEDQSLYAPILCGTEKIFSVPEDAESGSNVLNQYLKEFRGQNVCLALWDRYGGKCEKCGILKEVGSDYLAIKEPRTKRLIITETDKVKYISVFCAPRT